MTHQEAYFEQLRQLYPTKLAMVQSLTKRLGLSTDAVYRRLRGATALTANELIDLQQHYQLGFTGAGGSSMFNFSYAERSIKSPGDYIGQLEERMSRLEQLSGVNILLANPGIPFFHEVVSRRLFAFKLYIYGSTCWRFPGWSELRFEPDLIDHQVLDRAYQIGAYSYTMPGRELWTMGILNATLDQIEFMHLTDRFKNDNEALILLGDLQDLVNHLEAMSRAGRKFLPGTSPDDGVEFKPAQNELANNDNVIFFESDQLSMLFATFITPNFLQTTNPTVCQTTKTWFNTIDELSTPLGATAGKHRKWYFGRLRQQLREVRDRIVMQAKIKI